MGKSAARREVVAMWNNEVQVLGLEKSRNLIQKPEHGKRRSMACVIVTGTGSHLQLTPQQDLTAMYRRPSKHTLPCPPRCFQAP